MPRPTTSAYRLDARRRLRAALAALPPGASDADKRRAVRAACPYLPRQTGDGESWPYICWLREARAALGAGRLKRSDPPPVVRFILSETEGRRGWLDVQCDWCAGLRRSQGCLVCAALRHRVLELVTSAAWRQLRNGGAPLAVLADWLEERGIEVPREGLL